MCSKAHLGNVLRNLNLKIIAEAQSVLAFKILENVGQSITFRKIHIVLMVGKILQCAMDFRWKDRVRVFNNK